MIIDKERKAKEQADKPKVAGGDAENSDLEESTESSDEDQDEEANAQSHADIDAIVNTPRSSSFKVADYLIIGYEEGLGRIEMPWYTEQKIKTKKEAPVNRTHEKKNFKGLHESETVAKSLVQTSLKTQSDTLKERI